MTASSVHAMQTHAANLIIHTQDLVRTYILGTRLVPALRGVNLDLPFGQFWLVKGRSGSGKTTLLNCLGGLDMPTSGRVTVLGEEISRMDDAQRTAWRRDHVGLIFQSFGLLPTLSAYENIELALRLRASAPLTSSHSAAQNKASPAGSQADYSSLAARRARTLEVLDLVGLDRWKNHRPYEMSGGQQQRVAIARALVHRAPCCSPTSRPASWTRPPRGPSCPSSAAWSSSRASPCSSSRTIRW